MDTTQRLRIVMPKIQKSIEIIEYGKDKNTEIIVKNDGKEAIAKKKR